MTIFLTTSVLGGADELADRVGIISRVAWWPRISRCAENAPSPGRGRGEAEGDDPSALTRSVSWTRG